MVKEKRILSYFIGWLLIGFVLFIVGSSNIFALEVNFENLTVQGYDNIGSSLTSPSVFNCSNGSCGMEITTTANSYGGAWGIQSPIPLISNHSYAITLRIRNSVNTGITLSSKPNIAVGTSLGSAKYNYEHSDFWNTTLHSSATGNMTLQYVIKVNGAASYLIIPFTTSSTFTASFMIDTIIIEDLGTESLTQDEINNSLNNQTNELNNSINNAQNNINSNIDDMEQNIVNSNNENTEKLIDELKKGQLTCNYQYKEEFNFDKLTNRGYKLNGIVYEPTSNNFKYSDPVVIFGGYIYEVSGFGQGTTNLYKIGVYDSSMNWLFDFDYSKNTFLDLSDYENEVMYIVVNVNYSDSNKLIIVKKDNICVPTSYLQYKQSQETNNQLKESNETSKGILGTIKNILSYLNPFSENFFAYKLVELIISGLKELFIPSEDFFTNWWNDFSSFFDEKLGFLTIPFELFIDFVSAYLNLSEENIIISIPNITVPNFENHVIIEAQTFNWKELLESKNSLNLLWQLYLDFVDVFLILNFIGLCHSTYSRIFGGDTSNYEYYTVDDSYNFDTDTGEVLGTARHSERKTVRRKV